MTNILIILLLIIINGLLAMSEIAMVSARKARLKKRVEEGQEGARVALELAENSTRFLSTVQIGITLVGTLAGAFGGARVARQIAPLIERVSVLAPFSESISIGLVVITITYLSLVIGELVPKEIALNDPEAAAVFVARPMTWLARLTAPAVTLLSRSTDFVVWLLPLREADGPAVSDEEVQSMLEMGAEEGVFEPIEEEIMEQVFRLSDRRINALLTPRPDIVYLDVNDPPDTVRHKITQGGFSRYPVVDGDLDHVLGIALTKDLLALSLAGETVDLRRVMREPMFVPEGVPVLELLERFRQERPRMALVIDEHGALEGLVTVNNILEAMVGDVPEEDETAEPDAIQREDGSWLLDGRLPLDEFEARFNVRSLPQGADRHYHTLGGFMNTMLGRIPTSGDHFEWNGLDFEVVDMDGQRVDKVLLQPVETLTMIEEPEE